jgi:hypothetical protein
VHAQAGSLGWRRAITGRTLLFTGPGCRMQVPVPPA